ncbi:unnamed protein product [Eretmochelys imbricata]
MDFQPSTHSPFSNLCHPSAVETRAWLALPSRAEFNRELHRVQRSTGGPSAVRTFSRWNAEDQLRATSVLWAEPSTVRTFSRWNAEDQLRATSVLWAEPSAVPTFSRWNAEDQLRATSVLWAEPSTVRTFSRWNAEDQLRATSRSVGGTLRYTNVLPVERRGAPRATSVLWAEPSAAAPQCTRVPPRGAEEQGPGSG